MSKPKQFTRPQKKASKAKPAAPVSADDFFFAADLEEETGGKWRAGDPAKSGRAFVRALEIYDQGLQKHPASFDLAYNKARLELEITQQPALVTHIGLPLVDLLKQTLISHRYALRLNETNPDVLFNTAQVLVSLAEHLAEADDTREAISALHEALESLSACLARQEMLLEQQQADLDDFEEGGVPLDTDGKTTTRSDSEESEEPAQTATVESPVTPGDLLDTVHASISALTTLAGLTELSGLQTLGDMAHSLTETKAPAYVSLLPTDAQDAARFALTLDRATFVATFADLHYSAMLIDLETYVVRLDAFDGLRNQQDSTALCSEAEARTELSSSVMSRFEGSSGLPAETCWKQLTLAQDLYAKAAKLSSSAQVYISRGDVEMLRHRIAHAPETQLSDSIRKSAPTLAQNAQTYYKGAVRLATGDEGDLKLKAQFRTAFAAWMRALLYNTEPDAGVVDLVKTKKLGTRLNQALSDCVQEGLLEVTVAKKITSTFLAR